MLNSQTMNKTIIIILLSLLVTKINGQINFLNPCDDWNNKIEQIKKYNEDFNKALSFEFDEAYLIRFIAKPSFEPEYAFQIEKVMNNTFRLKVILFQENLWYSRNRDSIKVYTYEKKINKTLAIQLDSLFNKTTSSAITKENLIVGGIDGETYYFSRKSESGIMNCGQCWSPSNSTPLFELVDICKTLFDYAKMEIVDIAGLNDRIKKLYDIIE